MEKIIECVPNFSEGRDLEKITAIAAAITSVPETKLLHQTSDRDHNRTVITFIGPPAAVSESAFRAVQKAAELIDLTKHQGVHPRIGATDVLPLVPLKNISNEECVKLAEILGQRIGDELQIPVYLYEKSAKIPERQNLANVRKIEFRKTPDFGPFKFGSAGATVLGVRDILIAYNVNLQSNNLKIAQAIAKKIRESNGGLKFVKALGFELRERDIIQISMNLTNYKITTPRQIFDLITAEAAKLNTKILESEIIGMIPEDALFDGYREYLKLTHFNQNQILKF